MRKKILIGTAIVAVVVLAGILFGGQWAAAYYLRAGVAKFQTGDYATAESLFYRSLQFKKVNPKANFYLGKIGLGILDPALIDNLLYPHANYEKSAKYFEISISQNLNQSDNALYGQALNDLGLSYWMLKKYPEATKRFREHVEAFPKTSFLSRYLLAFDYYERSNNPDEALRVLAPAPQLAQADFQQKNLYLVYSLLAKLYYYFENYKETEKFAQLAIDNGGSGNTSESIQIANDLIAFAHAKRKDFAIAETMIQKSNQSSQLSEAHLCFLAKAYALGENYRRAIQTAERVAVKEVGSQRRYSTCLIVLADSYKELKDRGKAKKYYSEYITATDALEKQDIRVVRARARAQEFLNSSNK